MLTASLVVPCAQSLTLCPWLGPPQPEQPRPEPPPPAVRLTFPGNEDSDLISLIAAVLIIFELTGDYKIILPLMAAVVLATEVSSLLSADTIYTLKLRRRGIDIMRGRPASLLSVLSVADAMQPVPEALDQDLTLADVIARLTDQGRDALPVVDAHGAYRGTVTSAEVEASARENVIDATAADLAKLTPTLRSDQSLEAALTVLLDNERSGLPVLSSGADQVTGWLTHRDVLAAYSHLLHLGVAQIESTSNPTEMVAPFAAAPQVPSTDEHLLALKGYRVLEIALAHDSSSVGRGVTEVVWPPSCVLLSVRRADGTPVGDRQGVFVQGDHLTLLVKADNTQQVIALVEGVTEAN